MSRTQKLWALSLAALTAFVPAAAWGATDSDTVNVSASVSSALSLETAIIQNDLGVTSPVAAMNFGPLNPNGAGGLSSTRFFTVYLTAHTQQAAYIISQNGQDLNNNAGATLPDGAQNMVIVYVPSDNGGAQIPNGAALGTPISGTWVGNRTIYDSENTPAAERTVQAIYGLLSNPALGNGNFVPSNQPGGNYSGQITLTVTT